MLGDGVADHGQGAELCDVGEPCGPDDEHEVVGRDATGEVEQSGDEEADADEGLDVAHGEDGLSEEGSPFGAALEAEPSNEWTFLAEVCAKSGGRCVNVVYRVIVVVDLVGLAGWLVRVEGEEIEQGRSTDCQPGRGHDNDGELVSRLLVEVLETWGVRVRMRGESVQVARRHGGLGQAAQPVAGQTSKQPCCADLFRAHGWVKLFQVGFGLD